MDQDDDDGSETNYLGTSKGGLRNGVLKKKRFLSFCTIEKLKIIQKVA